MPGPNHRKLRCFVASAFGHADVDRVFSKLIRPTLRDLQVNVRRVDRVNHNDDIDNKIMELLQEADFCIADLTYARPSVYFEAGLAGATKPVIYIARKDHFRARDGDPAGNLRVHIDLQMKNIIPWGRSDTAFRDSLRKRVTLVTRPILTTLISQAERTNEREAFLALSQNQRFDALQEVARKVLAAHSFVSSKDRRWHGIFRTAVVGERTFSSSVLTARIYIEPQYSLKQMENIGYRRAFQPFQKAEELKRSRKRHVVVTVLATTGKISRPMFDRALAHHAKLGETAMRDAIRQDWESRKAVRSLVVPLDQIASVKEFRTTLEAILKFACGPKIRDFDEAAAVFD